MVEMPLEQSKGEISVTVGQCTVSVGGQFGRWTVVKMLFAPGATGLARQRALCRCDCGRQKAVLLNHLIYRTSTQCHGCAARSIFSKHGDAARVNGKQSRLYIIWAGMNRRGRPLYPDINYKDVRVCDEWVQSYAAFRDWAMANGYRDDLTLDRWPDQNGNYEPRNCRWATWKQQNRNKGNNRLVTAFSETKTLIEWLEDFRCIVGRGTLWSRLANGWSPESAIVTAKEIGHAKGAIKRRGSANHASKLNEQIVIEIRRLAELGIDQCTLGATFGVTQSTISLIVLRKKWEWL